MLERLQGQVPLTSFDRPEVRPVDAEHLSELLLAQTAPSPVRTEIAPNNALQISDGHAVDPGRLLLVGLHTYK